MISYEDFTKVDVRVGRIIGVEDFPEARKPAYKLTIDLGSEIGLKKSSAQIVSNYSKEELMNRLVMCVINFSPKQIGHFLSEVLTLGVDGEKGVVLIQPEREVELGRRLY